jgi:hypothetical protein
MPTGAADVCLQGKNRSDRRIVKVAHLTHNGNGGSASGEILRGGIAGLDVLPS